MKKLIEFRNTNFSYNSQNKFEDFCMDIEQNDIISLIGPSGSGKTTLLKMICHKLPNDTIYYNGQNINSYNVNEIRRKIIVVFDEPFKKMTIEDELIQYLGVCDLSLLEKQELVRQIIDYFDLNSSKGKNINKLSLNEKTLIKILKYLIIEPEFIAIDCLFSSLNKESKKRIIDFIKERQITLLNVTNDLNDTLYGNKIYILSDFTLVLEGPTQTVLKTDTMLKRFGFKLPDEVELSIELINYGVLNKIYLDKEKLVNSLWK